MAMSNLVALLAAAAAGAVFTWFVMTIRRQNEQLAEYRQQLAAQAVPPMQWAENMRLDHRAQLVSVASLVKLSARDNLDALMRLSPEMVREVVESIAPQLFTKEVR